MAKEPFLLIINAYIHTYIHTYIGTICIRIHTDYNPSPGGNPMHEKVASDPDLMSAQSFADLSSISLDRFPTHTYIYTYIHTYIHTYKHSIIYNIIDCFHFLVPNFRILDLLVNDHQRAYCCALTFLRPAGKCAGTC